MKKLIASMLLFSFLLSGCGSTVAPVVSIPTETVPASSAEPTTEPNTEPTFSAEELFIQSLPEKLRQAYELGIVELALLEEPERPCTIEEAAHVLQKVYNLRFYEDSWMLSHTATEVNAAESATRGWFMTMMYAADAEALVGVDENKTYSANLKDLTKTYNSSPIADTLLGWYENRGYVPVVSDTGAVQQMAAFYGKYPEASKLVADRKDFDGDISIVSYALTRFDRITGEKLMVWDENRNLRFNNSMTVQEVVETALRYHNALESKPDFVPYGEPMHYDETIITPDLLARETTLPDASCSHLPSEWHGVNLSETGQADQITQAHELDVIKNAGFNFVRLSFDAKYYHGRVPERTYGKGAHPDGLNENRLKELDQLLAWCIERDIHLNLACNFSADWPSAFNEHLLIQDVSNAESLISFWKALAQRYADIPNTYLSFTIMDRSWGYNDEEHGQFLMPVVEAVRNITPDRCMIANVGAGHLTGKGAAQLGIALSSECYWGSDFLFRISDMSGLKKTMKNASWPYEEKGELVDGSTAMAKAKNTWTKTYSPDSVAAVAQEYGVGYMVHRWGPTILNHGSITERVRYSDETMQAYLTDMAKAMNDRGYGWCYTDWMGTVGIAYCYPLVEGSTYTQVGEYLWIDDEMTGWFRDINHIG